MTPQSPFAIANYFIKKSAETGIPLSPMKLIKLVYLAHGWHLALTEEPLIREPIEAWKYGPVVESLYHAFKRYGNANLPASATAPSADIPDDPELRKLLDKVWNSYAKYTAAQLSTLTHQPNTPWSKVYDGSRWKEIPNDVIAEHYKEKLDAARKRAAQTSTSPSSSRP
jgi:uncharacterized phage-associated protein